MLYEPAKHELQDVALPVLNVPAPQVDASANMVGQLEPTGQTVQATEPALAYEPEVHVVGNWVGSPQLLPAGHWVHVVAEVKA